MADNPFDLLDDATPDTLAPAPEPNWTERFWINFDAAQRQNTILGAAHDASSESRREERQRFDRKYDVFPAWQTWGEGTSSLAGQIVGTAASPENFIPIGLGEKVLVAGKATVTGLWARVFAGAVDSAAANAVSDATIQGIELEAGHRDGFDPVQYGASILLGTAIGGFAPVAVAGAKKVVAKLKPGEAPVPEANPFDTLDDRGAAPMVDQADPEASKLPDDAAIAAETKVDDAPAAAPVDKPAELPDQVEAAETVPADTTPAVRDTIGEVLSDRASEARGISITPEQTQRVIDIVAPDPGKEPRKPQSLIDFIAAEGGLRQSGELDTIGLKRKFVPGRGALVRATGMELDRAREAAAQAGYFNHLYGSADDATAKSTVADFLNLLDQETRGTPVYSMAEGERVTALKAHEEALASRADYKKFVEEMHAQINELNLGVSVDDGVLARASEIVLNEKSSPLDAWDRAVLEDEARLASHLDEQGKGYKDDERYGDIPFFDEGPSRAYAPAGGAPRGAGRERGSGRREGNAPGGRKPQDTGRDAEQAAQLDEFFSIATTPSGTHASGRIRMPQAMKPGAAIERIARVRETAEALAKKLEVHATRQGRISHRNALGVYNTKSGVVRMKSLDDFDTLTHEYGHHLDVHVPSVKGFIKKHSKFFQTLDYDPSKGRDYEGFAEFFRLWITNRAFVETQYPGEAREFGDLLVKTAPDMAKAIDAARDAWDDFLAAPSSVAVTSTIVSGRKEGWFASSSSELKKHGVGGTISEVLQRIYAFGFDDLNPIRRAVSYLQDLHLTNKGKALDLKVTSDPYKLARMSRGSYSAGHMDIMYGVADYRSVHPSSPSLRDAIIEAMGAPNTLSKWNDAKATEFGAYLWSRRAIGEWERFKQGLIPNPPDKLTEGDHLQNVIDMETANAQFVTAAAKVHEFARALWKKKYDAGLIDQTTYDEGLAIKDYVPGLRDFSSDTDMKTPGGPNKQGKTAKGGFARRFKGSKRDVINPLESLAADAYETSMAIARNDVVKALDRLSRTAGVGAGAIAERIPAKEMKMAAMVDPLEAVENAARAMGLSKPDIVTLRDSVESAVGSEKAAIFRPAIINEKGEPIVFFRDGGQLKALRLADGKFGLDMYRTISAMSQHEKNFWLELVAVPARLLRLGVTTAFEFIAANFIRDQAMAIIYYGKPFRRLKASLQGAADDLMGRETARNYARVYGISGGQEVASLSKAMAERDISALKRKGWLAQRLTSFRGILTVAEIAETSTRGGLFRTFKEEAEARGLDEFEALMEASWRARDHLDFDRRGSGMAALAKVIPFLNVSLQGLDKSARHMLAPIARKMLGQAVTPADNQALGTAVKAWARLAGLVTASVSLYALMRQHEDHDEISEYTRSTHWMIKTGEKWTAVPKPFDFGAFINLGEAAYDAMVEKDPSAAGRWLDSLQYSIMPPSLIEGNPAIKSYFEVKSNRDFFSDAPIVPDHLLGMEPFLQYTARTSALSRQLGDLFNVSPLMADHLITAHLGSWGRTGLSLYDMAQPDAPGFAWDDAPIARRFIKDAAKGSQSGTMFWDLVSTREGVLEGKAKSWKALAEGGDPARAQDYFAGLDDIAKTYVALSTMDAETRRLHPLIRARGAIEAISAMRRDMAAGRLSAFDGTPIAVSPASRTAADDILSTLAMALARNALKTTGIAGWAQRRPMDEEGFYRELEALDPKLLERLGSGYTEKKVWKADAIEKAWPELRDRVLAEGSDAVTADLAAVVKGAGPALFGLKPLKQAKPKIAPGG